MPVRSLPAAVPSCAHPGRAPTGQLCFLLPRNHLYAHAKEISSTSHGFRINRSHTPIQALDVAVYNPIFKKNSSTPCSRHARALPCSCAQLQRLYVAPLEASSSCCEGMTPLSLLPRVPLSSRCATVAAYPCHAAASGRALGYQAARAACTQPPRRRASVPPDAAPCVSWPLARATRPILLLRCSRAKRP